MHYAEPYRVKIVQNNRPVPAHTRLEALVRAEYNVYRLPRTAVYLDFVGTEGAGAMSDQQLAGLMIGDEAYAGSRNFYCLEEAARQVLGKAHIVPTHQGRGAENLLLRHLMKPGQIVPTNRNLQTAGPLAAHQGGSLVDVVTGDAFQPGSPSRYKGNVDLTKLKELLRREGHRVAFVLLAASVPLLGGQVMELGNLEAAAKLAREAGVRLVLDASQVASAAYLVKEWERWPEPLGQLIHRYCQAADIVYLSARQDAFCHTGGLIAVNEAKDLTALKALVVVFEGLHTYGGQAGRDMQAFARGLVEMADEGYHFFRRRKFDYLERHLRACDLPLYHPIGTSGPALDATALSPGAGPEDYRCEALAAALYLSTGVRVGPLGRLRQPDANLELLALSVPRRTYTERQIDYLIDAVSGMRGAAVKPLRLAKPPPGGRHELAGFVPAGELQIPAAPPPETARRPEPYIIKVVEPLTVPDRPRREKAIAEAGYNTFLLRSEDVYIDLLTDSGTSAMSTEQWARMLATAEAETGTSGYEALVSAVREVLGFRHVLPTHQGRAAEHILSQTTIRPGQIVVNNMYFTTTREHQEMAGGVFRDLIVPQAHDPTSTYPFKGDIDVDAFEGLIREVGRDQIAYICLEANVNMAGGQPVSMAGTRRLSAVARYYGIPLYWDATRVAENAYFIKWKEPGYQDRSIGEILRELMSYGDGCTVSAKKDLLVNIGGLLCLNDDETYRKAAAMAAVYEGTPVQGGLAARDLTAMAVGCREMTDLDYLRNRIEQIQYLAGKLRNRGVPIVEPPGGHAVFLDARRFLDHLPQDELPAQRLAAELYVECGVRAMERGVVSAGRDRKTGKHKYPKLELVRLTIPRRVYTYSHLDIVADGVSALYDRRHEIRGLAFAYEPETLRFFQARFRPL
jgi:tyrosine phenol-lyase